jgi:predicted GIY-YIG superfamily endonuclease
MNTKDFLAEFAGFYGNDSEYEKVYDIFRNEETVSLTDAYEKINKMFPDIELLGEFFLNVEETEYKKIKLDKRMVNNNIPCINIYEKIKDSKKSELSPFFKDMREKLKNCNANEYTLSFVINTIFEEFIKKYNELSKINEINKNLYNVFYNYFSNVSYSGKPESNNGATVKQNNVGYVYLASCATENVYKIGMSKNITDREKTLSVGNHALKIFAYTKSENPRKLESLLHNIYASKNLSGEWFELSKDELDDLVQSFCFNLAIEDTLESVAMEIYK